MRRVIVTAALLLLVPALLAACGGDDPGLTRAEVEEIVRAEMATSSASQGVTRAEVEAIVRAAMAAVPSKSTPAEYTQYFVDNAVARYESQGLDATLAHYNSPQSIDGQWYVFIIDENDLAIAHPDPERLGLDLKGWVGTDINGYEFGPAMLAADEGGTWVSYVYRNPESGGIGAGEFELKHVWVVRHDGLLFGSGWYIDADAFTEQLVSVAVEKYREVGLAETMAYFAAPGSALAGLEAAIDYYNAAETIDGHWFAFIGDPSGSIVGHSDLSKIGGATSALFGGAGRPRARGWGVGGVGVAAGVRRAVRRARVRRGVDARGVAARRSWKRRCAWAADPPHPRPLPAGRGDAREDSEVPAFAGTTNGGRRNDEMWGSG